MLTLDMFAVTYLHRIVGVVFVLGVVKADNLVLVTGPKSL